MSREYRVVVQGPGGNHNDPLSNTFDVWVARLHDHAVLAPTGQWKKTPEGTFISEPSIRLPAEAMEAFIEAIDAFKGQPSHSKTEAAVLREWLKKEQDRVDAVLTRAELVPE